MHATCSTPSASSPRSCPRRGTTRRLHRRRGLGAQTPRLFRRPAGAAVGSRASPLAADVDRPSDRARPGAVRLPGMTFAEAKTLIVTDADASRDPRRPARALATADTTAVLTDPVPGTCRTDRSSISKRAGMSPDAATGGSRPWRRPMTDTALAHWLGAFLPQGSRRRGSIAKSRFPVLLSRDGAPGRCDPAAARQRPLPPASAFRGSFFAPALARFLTGTASARRKPHGSRRAADRSDRARRRRYRRVGGGRA